MSIYMYEGLVGSGKTFEIVTGVIIPNLKDTKSDTRIFTNVPLNEHEIESEFFQPGYLLNRVFKIDPESFFKLIEDPENYKNSLIIIDECHEFFWSHKALTDDVILKFFAMHRHYACHIILATQNRSKVAKKIVDEVQFFHVCENYKALGFGNRYRYKEFFAKVKKPTYQALKRYKKQNFKFYSSFDPTVSKDIGNYNLPRKSGFNIWKYVGLLVLGIIAVKFLLGSLTEPRHRETDSDEIEIADSTNEKEQLLQKKDSEIPIDNQIVLYTTNGPLIANDQWKISGLIDLGKKKRYILKSPDGQAKVVWSNSEIKNLAWDVPSGN